MTKQTGNERPRSDKARYRRTASNLLPNEIWDVVSLGLGGHPYDRLTGLTYMHHRHYHPRLGHFISPDFLAPDIYEPSTYKHPYAYANGNPIVFWDPDGLDPKSIPFHKTVEDFGGDEDLYVQALIQFLLQKEFLTKPGTPYPGYTNFDPTSLMFTQIATPRELEYQIAILRYILRGNESAATKLTYGHFLSELLGIQDEYLGKDRGWLLNLAIFYLKLGLKSRAALPIRCFSGIFNPTIFYPGI